MQKGFRDNFPNNTSPDALTVIMYSGEDAEEGNNVPIINCINVKKLFPKLNARLFRLDKEFIRIDVTVPEDITNKARYALRNIIIETAIESRSDTGETYTR